MLESAIFTYAWCLTRVERVGVAHDKCNQLDSVFYPFPIRGMSTFGIVEEPSIWPHGT